MSYDWPERQRHVGRCPVNLYQEIQDFLPIKTRYAEYHILSIALEIIALALTKRDTKVGSIAWKYIDYIKEHYTESELNMDKIAAVLKIHRTTLSRIFQAEMDVSPGFYLHQYRVKKALSLLLESDLMIKEIAENCGFAHVNHFCKVIHDTTGMTPKRYRKKYLLSDEAEGLLSE